MHNLKRAPTHPGEVLKKDFLETLGLTQTRLAKELNTTFRTINEIINEKRNISPEMAMKLSRYLGTSAELWLNLQNQYDIYRIRARKPGIIERIKPCGKLRGKTA
ncbi:MAG: HigA family addiction module antitoxin [Deltaproteobacteria bacterium]